MCRQQLGREPWRRGAGWRTPRPPILLYGDREPAGRKWRCNSRELVADDDLEAEERCRYALIINKRECVSLSPIRHPSRVCADVGLTCPTYSLFRVTAVPPGTPSRSTRPGKSVPGAPASHRTAPEDRSSNAASTTKQLVLIFSSP